MKEGLAVSKNNRVIFDMGRNSFTGKSFLVQTGPPVECIDPNPPSQIRKALERLQVEMDWLMRLQEVK